MTGTKTQVKLIPLVYRIARWWHDDRARHFRYVCCEFNLESHSPGMEQDLVTRLREESDQAADKARYHWQIARAYEGESRK